MGFVFRRLNSLHILVCVPKSDVDGSTFGEIIQRRIKQTSLKQTEIKTTKQIILMFTYIDSVQTGREEGGGAY